MNKNKVGYGIGALLTVGLTLIVTGIILAFGQNVMGDIRDDMTSGSYEYNSTVDTIEGVGNLTEKFGLIATVSVAAIIVGVLMTAFAIRGLAG